MKYDWKEAGEEWSAPWGSSAAQWAGTILPRIRDFLPTGAILEIAPGFGRWTHYLKDYCQDLWIVDRSSECIEACRQRFAADSHVRCYQAMSELPDSPHSVAVGNGLIRAAARIRDPSLTDALLIASQLDISRFQVSVGRVHTKSRHRSTPGALQRSELSCQSRSTE
ncbi:MAG: hypothetical protein DMF07_00370 [Verrucomicrobia bacterium]|nr:MAG: hypothetical protein DMF07_00370 [Verrucomicrobiota bacterium]